MASLRRSPKYAYAMFTPPPTPAPTRGSATPYLKSVLLPPLPASAPCSPSINSVLCADDYKSSADLLIKFDLRKSPLLIRLGNSGSASRAVPAEVLHRPAVSPKRPEMRMRCEHLPWHIDVVARDGLYITVEDVINSLYWALRRYITEDEQRVLCTSNPHMWPEVEAAFQFRCETSDNRREEERKGICRIDILRSAYLFGGLYFGEDGELWLKVLRG